jgi:predicted outer membrane repeat protein
MIDKQVDSPELLSFLKTIYEDYIPFNKMLGLQITSLDLESVSLKLEMKNELVGNYAKGMLHGGAISATLDVTGGIIASLSLLKNLNYGALSTGAFLWSSA